MKDWFNSIPDGLIGPIARLFMRQPPRHRLFLLLLGTAGVIAATAFAAYAQYNQRYVIGSEQARLLSASPIRPADIRTSEASFAYAANDQNDAQRAVTVAAAHNGTGKSAYTAELERSGDRALKFGDAKGDASFRMVPLFDQSAGRRQDSRVVYHGSGGQQVYTFMRNGVKEDILLSEAPGDTASYKWRLDMGNELQAKLLPDGSVGIYSASPYLYGNLQVSDQKSQELIDKARRQGDKTNLAFVLPRPYIKDMAGKYDYDNVSFSLEGDVLTLSARNLNQKSYPLTIDPSVVVTTTNDFRTGNDDGMINYGTAGQIGRSNLTLGTTGAYGATTALTTARSAHTSVASGGYLYVLGGYDGTNLLNSVQYAPINTDGTIGAWSATTSFTTIRNSHSSVAYNGYLYVIGGNNTTDHFNDVQKALINTDGTLGAWAATTSFTTARFDHTSVAYNGYLYVIGGSNGTGKSDVQKAPINADGTVGTWSATTSLTAVRDSHTSIAYNGYLYVIGGYSSGYRNDVLKAQINADGTVGAWSTTTSFTTARDGHASVALGGYLYVIGGFDGANLLSDVQKAPINADGTIGTWAATTSFATARNNHASVAYNGYVYVIGGYSGSYRTDVQKATIDTGTPVFGTTGTYAATTSFTTARAYHASVAYNGYLYVIGGWDGTKDLSDVQKAPINADGTIGTWAATTSLPAVRESHAAVAWNGYLYVIGGWDGTKDLSDVQKAPINADGTVGTWAATTSFTNARSYHTSVAYNGYLYVMGGLGSVKYNDVQKAPINADGTLGAWAATTSFTTARYTHGSAVYNGYLYVVGGYDGTNRLSDVQKAPLNADGTVGTWVAITSLPAGRAQHESVAWGGHLYVIGGFTGSNVNDVQKAPINADGTIGSWAATTSFTTARKDHISVVWGGYFYVIGGWNGTTVYNDVQKASYLGPAHQANYERTIDVGQVAASIDNIVFNGLAVCGAELWYATAGSNGVRGAVTKLPFVLPGRTYAINAASQRYVWVKIILKDDSCGTNSNVTDITVNYTAAQTAPAAPTLSTPADTATGVPLQPTFQMRTTDGENDYLRYKIELCANSTCSALVRTIDQTASQTGWTGQDQQTGTAYTGSSTITSSTMATHNYQTPALSPGTQYWWRAYAIDPGGSNTFGAASAIQSFTTNAVPSAPTLSAPADGATGVGVQPTFQLRSSDANADYLRYRIEVCSVSDCSTILRTIDQTASQTGWSGQDAEAGTAYVSSATLSSSTIASHGYQTPALANSTQYWWRAYAVDPGGSNTWSPASTTSSFTTGAAAASATSIGIQSGTQIRSGTRIGN